MDLIMLGSKIIFTFVSDYLLFMTKKQQQILDAAVQLFAQNSFDGTSTREIADLAEVSEGLIFRHFKNKTGLLEAILEHGNERASAMFMEAMNETEPRKIIENFILLPFRIPKEQFSFWKLIYQIKWQKESHDDSLMTPIRNALIGAFHGVDCSHPEEEADLLMVFIDGMATKILLKPTIELEKLKEGALRKFLP